MKLLALWVYLAALVCAVVLAPSAHGRGKPTPLVICEVFGNRYCGEALRVAYCESRWDVNARNGQYRGIFQMGSAERRRYGHGRTAEAQARAALRYFRASGRDWSPWSCRWAAS